MLVDEAGRTLTFGQFRDRCEVVAAGLHAMGVGPSTVVSWQLPTRIETVVLSCALARLGAIQNPIIHIYREREVAFALRQTGAELFFVPGVWKDFDYFAMAQRIAGDLAHPPAVAVAYDTLPEGDPSTLPPPPVSGDEVRWVYYTSGTTSDPKGVRHTDGTLVTGGRGLALAVDMSEDDVGSIAFPFAHIAGPDYLVMVLANGCGTVLLESFVPAPAVEVLARYGATMAGGSTAFYMAYLNEQRKQPGTKIIPSLRLLSGGGAPMPPEIFHEVGREIGVKVTHGYGMTEIPMICMGSPTDTDEQLAGTVGKPVFGAELRLRCRPPRSSSRLARRRATNKNLCSGAICFTSLPVGTSYNRRTDVSPAPWRMHATASSLLSGENDETLACASMAHSSVPVATSQIPSGSSDCGPIARSLPSGEAQRCDELSAFRGPFRRGSGTRRIVSFPSFHAQSFTWVNCQSDPMRVWAPGMKKSVLLGCLAQDGAGSRSTSLPVSASQMTSDFASWLANTLPSADRAVPVALPISPWRRTARLCLPVATFQVRMVRSLPPEFSVLPSAEKVSSARPV